MTITALWPILAGVGLLLGWVNLWARENVAHFAWYFPILLLGAVVYLLVTGGVESILVLGPEQLGIGVVAMLPVVVLAFVAALVALRLRAPQWVLFAVPVVIALAGVPVADRIVQESICELTNECPEDAP